MKILCTKDEFALLVRNCMGKHSTCSGCPFACICSQGSDDILDSDIMEKIEDICEIVSDQDG